MKKSSGNKNKRISLHISVVILFVLNSCSPTINRPLFPKSDNAKELILSKYGKPSKVEIQLGKEKWTYNYI